MRATGEARIDAPAALEGSAGRPVLLATLDAPFDVAAAEFAVDAAVESGAALIVVNAVETAFREAALVRWDYVVSDELEQSLRAPAELAHSLGVQVERIRLRSPRPIVALVELVAERAPGLLVFGPDRTRLRAGPYRKALKAISERVSCLVWTPE